MATDVIIYPNSVLLEIPFPMPAKQIPIESVILLYADGDDLTPSDSDRITEWKEQKKYHSDLPDQIKETDWLAGEMEERSHYPMEEVLSTITQRVRAYSIRRASLRRMTVRTLGAAAAAILVVAGIYKYNQRGPKTAKSSVGSVPQKPSPSGGAVLTLSDHESVALDTVSVHSRIPSRHPVGIRKEDSNRLVYEPTNKDTGYNIFRTNSITPYILDLPDRSRVSLNKASVIRYPVAFKGKERMVELLSGEAEFLVTKAPSAPFKVFINDVVVKVLGTHFTIRAYPNDPEKTVTVLEEGRVLVFSGKDSLLLKPREQARVETDGSLHWSTISDVDSMLSWKDRDFHFSGKTLDQALREVARTYDLKLPDLSSIKGRPLGWGGDISKNLKPAFIIGKIQESQHGHIKFSFVGDSLRIQINP